MKVVISQRAYTAMLTEVLEKITTETGGLFLGAAEGDTWYVVEMIDPGPRSVFEVTYFEYDREYTEHLINKTAGRYDARLALIGLWHRHPGSMDVFSSTDDTTNLRYAKMDKAGAISGLINIDPSVRLTMYHVSPSCRYTRIDYEVSDELIPEKYMKLKDIGKLKEAINNSGHYRRYSYHRSASLKSFLGNIIKYFEQADENIAYGISQRSMNDIRDIIIDGIIEDVDYMSEELGIELALSHDAQGIRLSQDAADGGAELTFSYSEKEDRLYFEYDGCCYLYRSGEITEAFLKFKEEKDSERGAEGNAEDRDDGRNDEGGFVRSIINMFINDGK